MTTFAEYLTAFYPTFLRGPWGKRWAATEGGALDVLAASAKLAAKAGFVALAPSTLLPLHAADVAIEAAPGEGADSLRARVRGAWESWSWAGTRYGIAHAVGLLGYGTPAVWAWREVRWDSDATRWARIAVVFRGLPAWDGDALWDGDDVWDSARSVDAIESADPDAARSQLRRVLRQWISARDVVEYVHVAEGSLLWDVDILWDGDDAWDAGDGETVWGAPEWDTDEPGAVWDSPRVAWDVFC